MKIQVVVSWIVTCSDVVGYQHFGGLCCLNLLNVIPRCETFQNGYSFRSCLCRHHTASCVLSRVEYSGGREQSGRNLWTTLVWSSDVVRTFLCELHAYKIGGYLRSMSQTSLV